MRPAATSVQHRPRSDARFTLFPHAYTHTTSATEREGLPVRRTLTPATVPSAHHEPSRRRLSIERSAPPSIAATSRAGGTANIAVAGIRDRRPDHVPPGKTAHSGERLMPRNQRKVPTRLGRPKWYSRRSASMITRRCLGLKLEYLGLAFVLGGVLYRHARP